MRRLITRLVLVCGIPFSGVHAANADVMGEWLSQQGLVQHAQSGRVKVQAMASELALSALGLLGVPYKWGGNSARTGLDCSGFVKNVFAQAGIDLPRVAAEQAQAAQPIEVAALEPGDLVFFNTMRRRFSHVGIYIGDGRFVHAPRAGSVVRIEDMNGSYWQQRFNGARRVVVN
jgi:cell wall-associated NlpC family hydrolase